MLNAPSDIGVPSLLLSRKLSNLALNPITLAVAVTFCTAFLYLVERSINQMPFVMLCVAAISSVLFLISRRVYFSVYTALGVTTLISIASVLKYRTRGFDLHFYDVVFVGTDPSVFKFLLDGFAIYIVPFAVLLLGGLIALSILFRWDRTSKIEAPKRAVLMAVVFAVIPISYPLRADEPRYFHYLGGFNASAFFVSFLDLRDAAIGRSITDRFADMPPVEPFAAAGPCETAGPKPDIFVVFSESQTDLSRLKKFGIDQKFSEKFRSADGKRRALRVETFGGGSWMTNFSLMTGLSSLEFGWRAPYLTTSMEGKIHESLATELSRCGYKTVVLTPAAHSFVNEGPFLESIGFDEVLDQNSIGASEYAHPDRFYFEAARAFIAKHRKTDGRPLFLEVQTMFAHSPYSHQLAAPDPNFMINSGDPELDEYVQRVARSQKDFGWFIEQAQADSDEHPSIIMEFGDHQSAATRELMSQLYPDFSLSNLSSSAYTTHFTIHGIGTSLDMKSFDFPSLDIGYLGASVLQIAGMGKSPMFADLLALRDMCNGQLFLCEDRAAVDRHIQRRIASGMLVLD
jgi:phosphoglycerol transferase MdoB-like AlkP superfamily enzyme